MKLFVFTCLIASSFCAKLDSRYLPPAHADESAGGQGLQPPNGGNGKPSQPPVAILSQTFENNGDGSYKYSYEAENGIKVQEEGELKNKGDPEKEAQSAVGSFSYPGPDGKIYTITYIADENGFRPQGDHLPTPPPIPPEILESLNNQGDGDGEEIDEGYPDNSNGYPSNKPTNQYIPPKQPGNGNGNGNGNGGYRY